MIGQGNSREEGPASSPSPKRQFEDPQAEERPFRLAKYFSTIAIVIIIAASLTLAILISRQAENIITKRVEDDTIKLMENLNHQMHIGFLVPTFLEKGAIRLREEEQYEDLHTVILNTIHGFDVSRVLIYDPEGQVVYSTQDGLIGKFAEDIEAYLEALRLKNFPPGRLNLREDESRMDEQEIVLRRLRERTVLKLEGQNYLVGSFFPQGEFILRGYKAMEDYGTGGISGVLAIDRDLSLEFRQIARMQFFALLFAVFIALMLTLALRWVVGRGEAIINQRNREQQALQERLGQAERLAGLGSMVTTVAHEIRNPLSIIHSTADLLERVSQDRTDENRLIRTIVEEADRLDEVVTEFLDFARPQTPKLTAVLIEELLEELLASLEVILARAGVEVRCRFEANPRPISGDRKMLHRAFLNLLVNAIQAMPDGGLLTIVTKPSEENPRRLLIHIEDTGPGLSPEAEQKIFSPFYTTKAKGTGLGLIIVRNIIQSHDGRLKLVSSPDGRRREEDSGPGLLAAIELPYFQAGGKNAHHTSG